MTIVTPNDLQQWHGGTHKMRPVNQPAVGTILALGYDGSYYSTDGTTFVISDLPHLADNWIVIANNRKVVVAMTSTFTTYRSTDGGKTWAFVTNDATNGIGGSWDVTVRDFTRQLIYVSKFNAFFFTTTAGFGKSFDNGVTWEFESWLTKHSAAFQLWWYPEFSEELGIVSLVTTNARCMWTEDLENFTIVTSAISGRNPDWGYILWVPELAKFISCAYDNDGSVRILGQQSTDGKIWGALFDFAAGGELAAIAFGPGLGPNVGRLIFTRSDMYYRSDSGGTTLTLNDFTAAGGAQKNSIIWSTLFNGFYTYDGTEILFSPNGLNLNWTQIFTPTPPTRLSLKQFLEVT